MVHMYAKQWVIWTIAILLGLGTQVLQASPGKGAPQALQNPMLRNVTTQVINWLKAVETRDNAEKTLSPKASKENTRLYRKLDGYIDFESITSTPLAKHGKTVSRAQRKTIQGLFREAFRSVAYQRAGSILRKSTWVFLPSTEPGHVVIAIEDEEEDVDVELAFHWHKLGPKWRLYDLSFDGMSVVLDYENQFSRIINKDGAEVLIQRLRKKVNALKVEQKKNESHQD